MNKTRKHLNDFIKSMSTSTRDSRVKHALNEISGECPKCGYYNKRHFISCEDFEVRDVNDAIGVWENGRPAKFRDAFLTKETHELMVQAARMIGVESGVSFGVPVGGNRYPNCIPEEDKPNS